MNWLVLAFSLHLGFTPDATVFAYQPPAIVTFEEAMGVISSEVEARFWSMVYIGGSLTVPVWKIDGIGFWPMELQSEIRAGVRLGGIEIGWSHLCTHPVMPYSTFGRQALWEGFYNEFHLKFSGEVKF
jgi:hypothetical protein